MRDFEMGIKSNRYLGYREWAISTHQSNVEAMDWLWHDSSLVRLRSTLGLVTRFG